MGSTGFRYTSSNPNRAAIRAVLGGSPTSGISRDQQRRANRVEDAVRARTPRRTGRLAATVRQEAGRNQHGAYIHIVVGNSSTPYLGYLINGSDPHLILPRFKKALRFTVGGRVVFAKRVRHPGTRPNNWLRQALNEAR